MEHKVNYMKHNFLSIQFMNYFSSFQKLYQCETKKGKEDKYL